MAKVKITGHASGSGVFTITAPNSNTDRTITLPDASVTLGTDATKLPLAGGTMTGALTVNAAAVFNETSADVDFRVESNGLTHALFVDGGTNRVGIGTGTPDTLLEVQGVANVGSGSDETLQQWNVGSDNCKMGIKYLDGSGNRGFNIGTITENDFNIKTNDTNRIKFTYDGLGVSQFTSAAWVNWNGTNTVAILDSYNVTSIVDVDVGRHKITIALNMANANYAIVGSVSNSSRGNIAFGALAVGLVETYTRESHSGDYTDYGSNSTVIFGDQ